MPTTVSSGNSILLKEPAGGEEIVDKEKKEFNRAKEKILRRSSTSLEFKQQAEHRISLPHDAARRWPARCLDARGIGPHWQRGHA